MKKILIGCVALCVATSLMAQRPAGNNPGGGAPTATPSSSSSTDPRLAPFNIPFNPDATVVSEHEATIKGVRVPYKATVGTMPVWDKDGKIEAGVFFYSPQGVLNLNVLRRCLSKRTLRTLTHFAG